MSIVSGHKKITRQSDNDVPAPKQQNKTRWERIKAEERKATKAILSAAGLDNAISVLEEAWEKEGSSRR